MILLPLVGCHVAQKSGTTGDDVSVGTPLGRVEVRTKGAAANLGMTVYPGAVLLQEEGGKENAADVDIAFGDFKLRSQSAAYRTSATSRSC